MLWKWPWCREGGSLEPLLPRPLCPCELTPVSVADVSVAERLPCARLGSVGPDITDPEMGVKDSPGLSPLGRQVEGLQHRGAAPPVPSASDPLSLAQYSSHEWFPRTFGLMPDAGRMESNSRGPRKSTSPFRGYSGLNSCPGDMWPSSWVKL